MSCREGGERKFKKCNRRNKLKAKFFLYILKDVQSHLNGKKIIFKYTDT